jgi:hypothetical protein
MRKFNLFLSHVVASATSCFAPGRMKDESAIVGKENVHQLQDHQTQGYGACDLQEPKT